MNSKIVELPRKLVNQLLHQAQVSAEQEVCGFISIKNNTYQRYKVENIAEQTDIQFLMEPKQQVAAMKTMRESGEELFAIYHSHPSAPAIPAYPDAYYLIISLNTKGVLEMRCFKLLHDENIVEIILEMTED